MTKKLTCLILLLIFTLTIFVFAGCEKKEEEYIDNGLRAGFEVSAGDASPSDYCAFSSDISEFDINDTSLEFYFGSLFSSSLENELENGRNYPYAELYFKNEKISERYFIKKTDGYYTSEEYRCEWILDENNHRTGVIFNHHETITIPKELFIGETGKIAFSVYADCINDTYHGSRQIASIWIHYKMNEEKVILSNKEF